MPSISQFGTCESDFPSSPAVKFDPKRGGPLAFCDAHLHLGEYADAEGSITFARGANVVLYSASTDFPDSERNLEFARRSPDLIKAFVGVHPSEAGKGLEEKELESLSRHATGIGEVGLDPKYSAVTEGSAQLRIFRVQLELAERLGRPVQVHSRGAEQACLDNLGSFDPPSVLLHWFEGSEVAPKAAAKGYYVSFGPAILYSKKLAGIARSYPADLILTESDAPVTYSPLGEAVSGPSLIPSVVFFLSQLLGLDFAETANMVSENSRRYLEGKKG